MAVTTKKYLGEGNGTTTTFGPLGIELNNPDDLDVYLTPASGGTNPTRVLQLKQTTTSTALASHPQVNDTTGLYWPPITVGTALKNYTISSDNNNITFNSAPASGEKIFIERRTRDSTGNYTSFTGASTIRPSDLNLAFDEVRFTAQEARNKAFDTERQVLQNNNSDQISDGHHHVNAEKYIIYEGEDSSAGNDLILRAGYITQPSSVVIPSENGTLITTASSNVCSAAHLQSNSVTTVKIAADAITGAKIADDQIDSEHYVDGSIDTAHLGNAQVTTAKVADSNITTAKIADSNVTTAKIADANVTTAKLADANVTTAKLADDSVTNAKVANNAINTAELVDDSVTTAKIVDSELKTLAGMQSGTASILASTTALTATTTEINQISGKTLDTTIATPPTDNQIPTAKAVNDRILAVTNALGGFVAINDRLVFPTTHPDPSGNAGTVVSISQADGLVINGSGVATNARTTGSNSDNVTITGFPASMFSETLGTNIGLQVQTTSTTNTYTYHKILAKEADVLQLSDDINDFFERYRIGASNPTSSLDDGDLFFNTTSNKMLVYNATGSSWDEVQSVGNFFINTISSYSGTGGNSASFNGSAYRFVLSNAGANAEQHIVSINGVLQKPNSGTSQPSEGFAIDGSSIILASAPAAGADYFIVTIGASVNIGAPSNNTVSTASLQNQAVTTAKLGDASVTYAKIQDVSATDRILGRDSSGAGSVEEITPANLRTMINVEDGATADQTNAEIRAAVEAASDSNVFTDADHSKLNAIEASATADQTDAEIRAAVEAATDSNVFTDADHTKLNGIATSANNYTHPNHSGDVTSSGDGATTIANDAVTGAKIADDAVGAEHIEQLDADLSFADSAKAKFGAGDDLEIYHNGTHSFIDEKGTGNLYLSSADELQLRRYATNEKFIRCIGDGAVEIYHDNEKVFETADNGIKVLNTDGNGTLSIIGSEGNDAILQLKADDGDDAADHWRIVGDADGSFYIQNWAASAWETNIKATGNGAVVVYYDGSVKFETNTNGCLLGDNSKLQIGGGADLQIYHDGTHSYITNATNALKIKGDLIRLNSSTGDEMMLAAHLDGAVELYHNNVKRLETTDSGIAITGPSKGVCTNNLVINGNCVVAQRGTTSSTADSIVVDRFYLESQNNDETPTHAQVDIASGTTPHDLGFRKAWKVTNGNQTSGAGASDRIQLQLRLEARDIANSGWNYASTSSFITLQFWIKSSVAQNFYGYLKTSDGTQQNYPFETGSLTANTWTKVTKTIPGNSNLVFDNDNGEGLRIVWSMFKGTDKTDSGVALNTWAAHSSGTEMPDNTSTWYTTNDATLEITGVQLELGKVANDFKHEPYYETLRKCYRYYWQLSAVIMAYNYNNANKMVQIYHPVTMRVTPTETITAGNGSFTSYDENTMFYSAYASSAYDATSAARLSSVKFSAEL